MLGNQHRPVERNSLPDSEIAEKSVFDLYCIGGSSVDLLLKVPHLPARDQKLVADFSGVHAGGLVANTACAGAALGLRVGWHGQVGDDDFGRFFRQEFDRFGVDHKNTQVISDQMSDLCIILLEPSGERTILVVPTNKTPPELSPAVMDALVNTRIVYSLPWPPSWFQPIAETVRANNGKVAIDVEGSSPVHGEALHDLLAITDMVFCSQEGLQLIAGRKNTETGIRSMFDLGVQSVIATLGGRGAVTYTPTANFSTPAFQDIPVADTTGAGDCFHAAYMAAILDGASFKEALQFASAAAALAIQHIGPRNGLPDRDAVNQFLSAHNLAQGIG
jgi:sugar/nucleoside kinase (ribokinase family)